MTTELCERSSKVEPEVPLGDGGSTPTRSLQYLRVVSCGLADIKAFIEEHHYSHSVFGITGRYFYKVIDDSDGALCGAAIFGPPAGMGVARKYAPEPDDNLVELRRFVLTDDCPRNAESRLIAYMLRDLRRGWGVSHVLSYADPAAGHVGVIYRAAGFKYVGTTSNRKHVMWKGKKYPDRNIHQTNFPYHADLRAALADGSATRIKVPGKHIYLKELMPTRRSQSSGCRGSK